MAYTFSEGLSTAYYSENKTALTDVLQLLPDNTNKEITLYYVFKFETGNKN